MLNLKDNPKMKNIMEKRRELTELMDKKKIKLKEYNTRTAELDEEMRAVVKTAQNKEVPKPKIEVPTIKDAAHSLLTAKDTKKINPLRVFKGILFKGKKAQQQGGAFSNARVNPILILGICIYITPLVMRAMGMGLWAWLQTLGFILIIIGVILSFIETVG